MYACWSCAWGRCQHCLSEHFGNATACLLLLHTPAQLRTSPPLTAMLMSSLLFTSSFVSTLGAAATILYPPTSTTREALIDCMGNKTRCVHTPQGETEHFFQSAQYGVFDPYRGFEDFPEMDRLLALWMDDPGWQVGAVIEPYAAVSDQETAVVNAPRDAVPCNPSIEWPVLCSRAVPTPSKVTLGFTNSARPSCRVTHNSLSTATSQQSERVSTTGNHSIFLYHIC